MHKAVSVPSVYFISLLVVKQCSHVLQGISWRGDELVMRPPQARSSLSCHFGQELSGENVAHIDGAHCIHTLEGEDHVAASVCDVLEQAHSVCFFPPCVKRGVLQGGRTLKQGT